MDVELGTLLSLQLAVHVHPQCGAIKGHHKGVLIAIECRLRQTIHLLAVPDAKLNVRSARPQPVMRASTSLTQIEKPLALAVAPPGMPIDSVTVPSELLGWAVKKPPWGPRVRWHPAFDVPLVPKRLPENHVLEEEPPPAAVAPTDASGSGGAIVDSVPPGACPPMGMGSGDFGPPGGDFGPPGGGFDHYGMGPPPMRPHGMGPMGGPPLGAYPMGGPPFPHGPPMGGPMGGPYGMPPHGMGPMGDYPMMDSWGKGKGGGKGGPPMGGGKGIGPMMGGKGMGPPMPDWGKGGGKGGGKGKGAKGKGGGGGKGGRGGPGPPSLEMGGPPPNWDGGSM